jgi:phosphatidylglycerol:prolipoprotein diacylglycerol transferase
MINQISLGLITIHVYGIIASFSIFLAFIVTFKRAKKFKIKTDFVYDLFLIVFLFALVGARLYHVIDQWSYYFHFPLKIFAIWEGGLAIYGALIGGFFAVWLFSKTKKLNFLSLLDLIAPSVALAQSIGRWGNFFNQEAYGYPTNLSIGIHILPQNRLLGFEQYQTFHPVFLYESLITFLIFLILIRLTPILKKSPGKIAAIYFVLYGTGRFFLEFLRLDTQVLLILKPAQFFSLFFIIIGVYLWKPNLFLKNLP